MLLIARSSVILQKLIVVHLPDNYTAFYGNPEFFTVFISPLMAVNEMCKSRVSVLAPYLLFLFLFLVQPLST
jgi:hypothetical protein